MAQNLIPNPGFESFDQCPPYPGQIHLATFWDAPNNQTTDFFHRCAPSTSGAGVPDNLVGRQEPHEGDGYVGLRAWVPVIEGNPPYREYLTIALNAPLDAGKKYAFRCWVSVAEASSHFSDGVGFLFTDNALPPQPIYLQNPQLRCSNGVLIEDLENWIPYAAPYYAQGRERFLTVGNFTTDQDMLRVPQNNQPPTVYYYLDDLRLYPCPETEAPRVIKDTFICRGEPLLITAPEGAFRYQWSDGRNTRERWIEKPGNYLLTTDWVCDEQETLYRVESRDCDCRLHILNPLRSGNSLVLPYNLGKLDLRLYNTLGQQVAAFDENTWPEFSGFLPAGIYFWESRLRCDDKVTYQSGKVIQAIK